ncbi:hypothetical protein PS914_06332 [Pseudomonas fluorescens]|uniref:RHS repeat-associated core domain-containing protein n=1 Tax=Pseudomonas fluorescens TaxID=294 RepID=UPI00123EDD9D|nr:RHS repeat-associated core domain-containing protein [Pseudomonas fluorescens]VVQ19587.1 hypothetical protein PS914_06332 [Pseudomonas fluorescens]
MPTSTREILLGRYHYDPLDRLVDCAPLEQAAIQRYYCKTRLSTELQGTTQRTIVQHDDQLLAQQQREGDKMTASLLATDQQRSVLNALDADRPHPLAYTPYGHRPPENGLLSLLGFTGERPDAVTGHYHLGNGYRQFNPVLMRFNSPDSWSPFKEGGLNTYTYCVGDPVNKADPNGHSFLSLVLLAGGIGSIVGGSIILSDKDPSPLSFVAGVALIGFGVFLTAGGLMPVLSKSGGLSRAPYTPPPRRSSFPLQDLTPPAAPYRPTARKPPSSRGDSIRSRSNFVATYVSETEPTTLTRNSANIGASHSTGNRNITFDTNSSYREYYSSSRNSTHTTTTTNIRTS